MAVHRPEPGFLLRSVALRYVPRVAVPARAPRGQALFVGSPIAAELPAKGGPCRRDRLTAAVEAVLFLALEPIASRRLSQAAGLDDPTQARTLIRRLNDFYERDRSPYRIEEVAGGWQLLTHPSFGGWLRRVNATTAETRLSAPALETLAVVAYRQPVVRAEVESIRGVQSSEMLRQLMDRDLVRIVGRSHDLGRPFLYGTTQRFLQAFGLRHLDDLPRAGQLRPRQPAGRQPAATRATPGAGQDVDIPELFPDLKEEQHT